MGITSSSSNKGTSRCTDGLEASWPFYKAARSNGKDQAWPSVGWTGDRPLELALPDGFKFYMYDDGDLNTTRYEECFMQSVHLAQDLSNIDHVLPVFRRMYAAGPQLHDPPLPSLRVLDTLIPHPPLISIHP
jgi:hypothetical protein